MPRTPAMPSDVQAVFDAYPAPAATCLREIRAMIFDVAATEAVGPLAETLKWGEPAYLTEKTKAGSTLRIAASPKAPGKVGLFFNCQTSLVSELKDRFDGHLAFEGNRALWLSHSEPLPKAELEVCIAATLTYHRRKARRAQHA